MARSLSTIIMVMVCCNMALLMQRTTAEQALTPFTQPIYTQKDLQDCWQSVVTAPVCWVEIWTSFVRLQFRISPVCCKTLIDINQNCFSILFPGANPIFMDMKNRCVAGAGAGAVAGANPPPPRP
ncbi:hypothetical protein Ancab_006786 [Ancistrocladus abbreviatus]